MLGKTIEAGERNRIAGALRLEAIQRVGHAFRLLAARTVFLKQESLVKRLLKEGREDTDEGAGGSFRGVRSFCSPPRYRLVITKNHGGRAVGIYELDFFGA